MSGHRLIMGWMVICPLVLIFCLAWWVLAGPMPTPLVWLAWAALLLWGSTLAALFVELVWETDHPPFAPVIQPAAPVVVKQESATSCVPLAVWHDDPYWYSSGWDEDEDVEPASPQAGPEAMPAPDPRAGWSRWDYVLSEIESGTKPGVQS